MNENKIPKKIQTIPENETLSDEEKEARLKKQHNFYTIKTERDGSFKSLRIKKAKIVDKLLENKFYRFDLTEDNFTFISVNNNTLKECSVEIITDCFFDYVRTLEPCNYEVLAREGDEVYTTTVTITRANIREALLDKVGEYFSKRLLARLVYNNKIEIMHDEKNKMYFYYRNGYVEVTQNGYTLKDYSTLDKLIWESQVLDRDFQSNKVPGMYEKFIQRVAGYKDKERKEPISERIEKRIESIRTMMAYLLHNYFDYKLKCPIFTDEKMSENGEPNGRTGKTLVSKALQQMKNRDQNSTNCIEINGKDFIDNGKHKYEAGSLSTTLVLINDIIKNYDIELMFNDITEGISVNKKNQQPFKINTKISLSTNKTIKTNGDSAKDRVLFFEFSDYWNKNYSPNDEFGCWFFKEWDQDEWNKFDTYMIECCMLFLQKGLIEASYINLNKREVIEHTSQEFVDFMTDFIESGQAHTGVDGFVTLTYDVKIEKQRLFNAFIKAYKDYDNGKFKQRIFTSWLRKYSAQHDELQPISKANQTEVRSNGTDWVIFKKK
jgi:hypothetical protein